MPDRLTYRSKWVVADPWTVLENGYVQVSDGTIEAVGSGTPPDGRLLDLGPGALTAPFVNAHTHLELSALKGMVPFDSGFRQWVIELLSKRSALGNAALLEGAADGIRELHQAGCRLVAEIATLGITLRLLQHSGLSGIFFLEHLGSDVPNKFGIASSTPFSSSLAAHAPHTSSPALIRHIKAETASAGLPMSVHLAESEDEWQFINTGRGDWADFLRERGVDFSAWPLPAISPVQYLHALGVLDPGTLAVHLIHCSAEDIALLRDKDTMVCFCPRSNFLLHKKLPDIRGFLAAGFKPGLGTDSLASSPSLSILDEMAFISRHYDNVSPADILAMGTVYGAAALGMGKRAGRLAPGFSGPPVYVPIDAARVTDVTSAIVTAGNAEVTGIQRDSAES